MTIKVETNDKGERTAFALHGRDLHAGELITANNVDYHLAANGARWTPFVFSGYTNDVIRKALRMFIDDRIELLRDLDADELKLENIRLRADLKDRIKEIDDLHNETPEQRKKREGKTK